MKFILVIKDIRVKQDCYMYNVYATSVSYLLAIYVEIALLRAPSSNELRKERKMFHRNRQPWAHGVQKVEEEINPWVNEFKIIGPLSHTSGVNDQLKFKSRNAVLC